MDKKMLDQYIDACELIRETEDEIMRIEEMQRRVVHDSVTGSNPEYPYEPRRFKIEGVELQYVDSVKLDRMRKVLDQRRQQAEEIKTEVEAWMAILPVRMQRIIRYHFFQGLTWERTARKIGKKATADSVRKEFERYFIKN